MNRSLEFGSFYKFAASLGLALFAAAATLPLLILRTLPADSPCFGSTKATRPIICSKVNAFTFAVLDWTPWFVGVLAITGVFCLGYGLFKWHARQRSFDRKEDLELDELKARISALSPIEANEKVDEEVAREEVVAEPPASPGLVVGELVDSPSSDPSLQKEAPRASEPLPSFQERRTRLRRIEQSIGDRLSVAMRGMGMELRAQAKIGDPNGMQVPVDFAGWDLDRRQLVVCEVMFLTSLPKNLRMRLSVDLPALQYRLKSAWPTPNLRLIVVIASSESGRVFEDKRLAQMVRQETGWSGDRLDLIFVGDETDQLPSATSFREVLLSDHPGTKIWRGGPDGEVW